MEKGVVKTLTMPLFQCLNLPFIWRVCAAVYPGAGLVPHVPLSAALFVWSNPGDWSPKFFWYCITPRQPWKLVAGLSRPAWRAEQTSGWPP